MFALNVAVDDFSRGMQDSGVAGAEKIVFKKCDAYEVRNISLEEFLSYRVHCLYQGRNIVKMQEKGLKKFPMLYVSIEGQGMGKKELM